MIAHERERVRPSPLTRAGRRRPQSSPISLIGEGRGFWRYVETDDGLRFLTEYSYDTRWGRRGE